MDIVQSSDQPLCLPEEIIEEILSRIPVKSLLKFRCVSKKWRSLIGAKRFFKAHLEKSMKNPSFERHKVIARTMPPYYELKHYSLHSLLNDPSTDSSAIDDSVDVEVGTVCVVGCCDGLVCILLDRRDFVLWNPSTRMSRKLPDLHDKIKNGLIVKYGFGSNESNGDYKVFAVFSLFGTCWEYGTIGKVYSLKRNSWRVIDENNACPFGEGGKFVKGKLHWGRGHGGEGWDIVSWDLQSEVYGMVEQPSYLEGDFYRKLGVLRGCLSVFISSHRSHVDVWVMKEYGVKESWCKFVRVPPFDGPHEIATLPTPFAIGPNGEIMLVCESSFVVYYPENGMFRHPRVANFAPFREVGVYVESLACLSHEDQEEEEESCMKDGIMS